MMPVGSDDLTSGPIRYKRLSGKPAERAGLQ